MIRSRGHKRRNENTFATHCKTLHNPRGAKYTCSKNGVPTNRLYLKCTNICTRYCAKCKCFLHVRIVVMVIRFAACPGWLAGPQGQPPDTRTHPNMYKRLREMGVAISIIDTILSFSHCFLICFFLFVRTYCVPLPFLSCVPSPFHSLLLFFCFKYRLGLYDYTRLYNSISFLSLRSFLLRSSFFFSVFRHY